MSESGLSEAWSLEAQPDAASVERKVLSSYGWCSHFVGEPVTYAIVKEQRGVTPSGLDQVSWKTSDRLPFSQHPPAIRPNFVGRGE